MDAGPKYAMAETMTTPLPDPVVPYVLTLPAGEAGAMVFASPHSGGLVPDDFGPVADLAAASLRSAEDALVDRLIGSAPDVGIPVIAGRISRAYLDLNRAPDELDPELIDGGPVVGPGSAKVQAGFGVIARRAGDGAALYDRRLGWNEAKGRLARVHTPYHDALAERMQAARAGRGVAILVDWHSMPSRASGGRGRSVRGADVVLGDRHGSSCAGRVTRRLRALFEGVGWTVGLNQPYAGGYSTQIWGRPDEGFQAVQVELNRALYFDEKRLEPSADFERCRSALSRIIATLGAEDWHD